LCTWELPATMKTLQGNLLIASPSLADSNFEQTVTLVVEHNEEGAYGVMLNCPSQDTVKEVWRESVGSPCDISSPVYIGGPCEGFLTAVHSVESLSNIEVAPGIHYTQEPDKIKQLVAQQPSLIRFFVGFSGWSAGQLEAEMREESWLTAAATTELVFGDAQVLWTNLVKQLVGKELLLELGIKHVPDDPTIN
jgi:putative transcriptional regulator